MEPKAAASGRAMSLLHHYHVRAISNPWINSNFSVLVQSVIELAAQLRRKGCRARAGGARALPQRGGDAMILPKVRLRFWPPVAAKQGSVLPRLPRKRTYPGHVEIDAN